MPRCPPHSHNPNWDPNSKELLLAYSTDVDQCFDYAESHGKTVAEWTPAATYLVEHIEYTRLNRLCVTAHVHADNSFLMVEYTRGTLFYLHRKEDSETVYSQHAVPRVVRHNGSEYYKLGAIANRAYALLEKAVKTKANCKQLGYLAIS